MLCLALPSVMKCESLDSLLGYHVFTIYVLARQVSFHLIKEVLELEEIKYGASRRLGGSSPCWTTSLDILPHLYDAN
jgi:hypothetical protein